MGGITRKKALLDAIEIVKTADIPARRKEELIEKLNLCVTELPFAKWTEEAIYDACDQFVEEHGRIPRISEFDRAGLPSHAVVQNRLGISVRELRKKHFPPNMLDGHNKEEVIETFRKEFIRCGARTQKEYDEKREKGQPCAQTLLKKLHLKNWSQLLNKAGLLRKNRKSRYIDETTHEDYVVTVSVTYPWEKL